MGNRSGKTRLFGLGGLWCGLLAVACVGRAQDLGTINKSTSQVPSVLGLSAGSAKSKLQAAGLAVRFSLGDQPPTAKQALTSYAQQPLAGQTVSRGTVVTVTIYARAATAAPVKVDPTRKISTGTGTRHSVELPDLVGQTTIEAKATVLALGLAPKFHLGAPAATAEKALTVFAQDPQPGTSLVAGSEVQITIYSRPKDRPEAPAGREIAGDAARERELKALQRANYR